MSAKHSHALGAHTSASEIRFFCILSEATDFYTRRYGRHFLNRLKLRRLQDFAEIIPSSRVPFLCFIKKTAVF